MRAETKELTALKTEIAVEEKVLKTEEEMDGKPERVRDSEKTEAEAADGALQAEQAVEKTSKTWRKTAAEGTLSLSGQAGQVITEEESNVTPEPEPEDADDSLAEERQKEKKKSFLKDFVCSGCLEKNKTKRLAIIERLLVGFEWIVFPPSAFVSLP